MNKTQTRAAVRAKRREKIGERKKAEQSRPEPNSVHLPLCNPPRNSHRRSRQDGWLGTRVRESQMTCACVRVHRRHRDDRGEEHERTAKANKSGKKSRREPTPCFCGLNFLPRADFELPLIRACLCVRNSLRKFETAGTASDGAQGVKPRRSQRGDRQGQGRVYRKGMALPRFFFDF